MTFERVFQMALPWGLQQHIIINDYGPSAPLPPITKTKHFYYTQIYSGEHGGYMTKQLIMILFITQIKYKSQIISSH